MRKQSVFLLAAIALLASCNSFNENGYKVDKVKANPSFYIPVAFGNLSMQSALQDKVGNAQLKTKPDGLLYLVYSSAKKTSVADGLPPLPPDEAFSYEVPLTAGTLAPTSSDKRTIVPAPIKTFSFGEKKLTEIQFKSTELWVTVTASPSNADAVFQAEFKLRSCTKDTKDGVAFSQTQAPSPSAVKYPLAGYVMTLTDNSFPFEITLIEKAHSATTVPSGSKLRIKLEFRSIDFKYMKGFFGSDVAIGIKPEGYEFVEVSDKFKDADISIVEPKLDFTIYNGVGAPCKVVLTKFEVVNKDKEIIALRTDPSSENISVNQPSGLGVDRAETRVKVTNGTEAFQKMPRRFDLNMTARINYDGLSTRRDNFCADTSTVGWRFKLEVPMHGKASKIYSRDTVSINLSNLKIDQVDAATLIVKASNEVPVDTYLQIYLLNEKNVVSDSVITDDNLFVKSSRVGANGELAEAGTTDKEINLNKDKIKKLSEAKKLVFLGSLRTARQPSPVDVKFKSSQKINIQVGLRATMKLEYKTSNKN
ncbi:MAG: hypothetical protein CRN43_01210 [Candidatus Nephrothrix sp. EaCA]|nr:MAG: hypothetical protein CRN43_01210 [Candidatus Nephrothrix sp. EaCA]